MCRAVSDLGQGIECGFVSVWQGVQVGLSGAETAVAEALTNDLEVSVAGEQHEACVPQVVQADRRAWLASWSIR
jgi:hypothetical protein